HQLARLDHGKVRPQTDDLPAHLPLAEGALDGQQKDLDPEWLGHEVAGSRLHGLDGKVDAAESRDEEDELAMLLRLDRSEQVDAPETLPPCCRTIALTTARPSPVPPWAALVVKNGSNSLSSTSGDIPQPLSSTTRRAAGTRVPFSRGSSTDR